MKKKLAIFVLSQFLLAGWADAQQAYFIDGYHGGIYGHYPVGRIWNAADPETFPRGGIYHLFGGRALLYQLPAVYIEVIRLLICLY